MIRDIRFRRHKPVSDSFIATLPELGRWSGVKMGPKLDAQMCPGCVDDALRYAGDHPGRSLQVINAAATLGNFAAQGAAAEIRIVDQAMFGRNLLIIRNSSLETYSLLTPSGILCIALHKRSTHFSADVGVLTKLDQRVVCAEANYKLA